MGPHGQSRGPPGEITWAPWVNHVGPHGQSRGPPGAITWAPRGTGNRQDEFPGDLRDIGDIGAGSKPKRDERVDDRLMIEAASDRQTINIALEEGDVGVDAEAIAAGTTQKIATVVDKERQKGGVGVIKKRAARSVEIVAEQTALDTSEHAGGGELSTPLDAEIENLRVLSKTTNLGSRHIAFAGCVFPELAIGGFGDFFKLHGYLL